MDALRDEDLARRASDRQDRDALSTLVGRYDRPIYGFLRRMLRDPHLAEEAAQETFLRMLRGLPTYRPDQPFERWLFRIALNCARTQAVRRTEQGIRERVASRHRPEGCAVTNPADGAARKELRSLVEDLPAAQKEALVLHYFQGLSHSEVAGVLEVPAGTVATRIHGGLETLRSQLGAVGMACTVGAVVDLLGERAAEAAPRSILDTVLAHPLAIQVRVPAAAPLQGGLLMSKISLPSVLGIALACLVGGTIFGYKTHAHHDRAEAAARPASPARVSVPSPRELSAASPAPEKVASSSNLPGPPAPSARGPVGVASAQTDPKTSKLHKLAVLMARVLKTKGTQKGKTKTVQLSPQDAVELMGFMADPELKTTVEKWSEGDLAGSGEFLIDMFDELGMHLSEDQKARLMQSIARLGPPAPVGPDSTLSTVDQYRVEVRNSRDLLENLMQLLTPDQQAMVVPIIGSGFSGVRMLTLSPADPEAAASQVLETWSKNISPLSEQDRLVLASTASLYAERLSATQANLEARYGPDVLSQLLNPPEFRMTVESSSPAAPSGSPAGEPPPMDVTRIRDGYDVIGQLLDLESQERQSLMSLLPDRSEQIKKAPPFLLVFGQKK